MEVDELRYLLKDYDDIVNIQVMVGKQKYDIKDISFNHDHDNGILITLEPPLQLIDTKKERRELSNYKLSAFSHDQLTVSDAELMHLINHGVLTAGAIRIQRTEIYNHKEV